MSVMHSSLRSLVSTWSCLALGVCVALCLHQKARGQETPQDTDARTGEAQAETDDADSSQHTPTAEDMLKSLRRSRPLNEVIVPESGVWSGDGSPQRKLWPEGWAIVERSGHLTRDEEWWAFAFTGDEDTPKMRLLPNANLEVMVRTAVHATTPIEFIISGQTTVYDNRNYLLVRSVMRDNTAAEPDVTGRVNIPGEPKVATNGSVESVLNVLKEQAPDSGIMDPRTRSRAGQAASAARPLQPDGSNVINRPARVVRRGHLYQLIFESDHPDNPEPPLTMLPNQHMLRMINETEAHNLGVVFVVSGEVTQFQGENFILVRSATRRLESANFSK